MHACGVQNALSLVTKDSPEPNASIALLKMPKGKNNPPGCHYTVTVHQADLRTAGRLKLKGNNTIGEVHATDICVVTSTNCENEPALSQEIRKRPYGQ